jgi:hypothetical protein
VKPGAGSVICSHTTLSFVIARFMRAIHFVHEGKLDRPDKPGDDDVWGCYRALLAVR